jgi:hypothetical protein
MPTATYTPLATVTLSSAASTITFSNIGSGYRDLILVCAAANGGSGSNNGIRFNGDTGSNYSRIFMGANGVGAVSSGTSTSTGFQYDNFGFTTNTLGSTVHLIQVLDISATDKHKTILTRANRAGDTLDALAGRWANTAAITSLGIYSITGENFLTGSRFDLYGVIA